MKKIIWVLIILPLVSIPVYLYNFYPNGIKNPKETVVKYIKKMTKNAPLKIAYFTLITYVFLINKSYLFV